MNRKAGIIARLHAPGTIRTKVAKGTEQRETSRTWDEPDYATFDSAASV